MVLSGAKGSSVSGAWLRILNILNLHPVRIHHLIHLAPQDAPTVQIEVFALIPCQPEPNPAARWTVCRSRVYSVKLNSREPDLRWCWLVDLFLRFFLLTRRRVPAVLSTDVFWQAYDPRSTTSIVWQDVRLRDQGGIYYLVWYEGIKLHINKVMFHCYLWFSYLNCTYLLPL